MRKAETEHIVSELESIWSQESSAGSQFNSKTLAQCDKLDSMLSLCIHEVQRSDSLGRERDIATLRRAISALRKARGVVALRVRIMGGA